MADDCSCKPDPFNTAHLVLGGGVVAALLGLVAYASVHNRRHQLEFDVLREDIQTNEAVLDRLLPGYTDALADEFTDIIARRTPEEDEAIREHVVRPWLERGGKPNRWSRRMFQKLGLE
jgi:hypothetical protein